MLFNKKFLEILCSKVNETCKAVFVLYFFFLFSFILFLFSDFFLTFTMVNLAVFLICPLLFLIFDVIYSYVKFKKIKKDNKNE